MLETSRINCKLSCSTLQTSSKIHDTGIHTAYSYQNKILFISFYRIQMQISLQLTIRNNFEFITNTCTVYNRTLMAQHLWNYENLFETGVVPANEG